jgi:hypothetical protein
MTSTRLRYSLFLRLIVALALLGVVGCGGSGNGSSTEKSPGSVGLDAAPRQVDTGDRIAVTVFLEDIHPNGVLLKLRMPEQFQLATGSTVLTIGDDTYDELAPMESGKGRNSDDANLRYLVYSLPSLLFANHHRGTLVLTIRADAALKKGRIEVDIDTNDTAIPDRQEFSLTAPNFTSMDSIEISARE